MLSIYMYERMTLLYSNISFCLTSNHVSL